MTELRDKIARALLDVPSAFALDEYPLLSARIPADVKEAYVLADAVLAVLDLDKVRAEAFGQGIRSAIDAVNKTGSHAPLAKAYLRKAEQ